LRLRTVVADITDNTPQNGGTMPTEATDDALIGLAAAARSLGALGRNEQPVAPETLSRWHRKGILLPDGSRLKLKAVCVGGKYATKLSWLREFSDTLTAAREVGETHRTPSERRRASEAAVRELEALGA
jgi:hypothetical protein